jgi:hypothetical protein
MLSEEWSRADQIFSVDYCLTGCGGCMNESYFTNCKISANLCSSIDIVNFFVSNKIPKKSFLFLVDKPFRPIPQNRNKKRIAVFIG